MSASKMGGLQLEDAGPVFYVETVEVEGIENAGGSYDVEGRSQHIGFGELKAKLVDSIIGIGRHVRDAVAECHPDEFSVDICFGFKGETTLIPVLLNGSGKGSVRIMMKWKGYQKKDEQNRPNSENRSGDDDK